ncbi:hypothetical protein HHI36_004432 [Cryptolaemus montrouzieri]|uniref:Glycosyl transferase CAP10 domain-containing protein n=1 Tax=Cryptolaemus montrouzieri TaxID=559131 RepID=A0ABD2NR64_9CUCU
MNTLLMIYTKFYLLLIGFLIIRGTESTGTCSKKSSEDCASSTSNGNKYSEEANGEFEKYEAIIDAAKREYEPCTDNICKCYNQVISKDLKPFRSGINEESIRNIKSKGTKYQIIDNKLYRENDCLFPARCSGVEHYLLKLLHKVNNTEFILNTRDWPQIFQHHGPHGPVFSFSKTDDYLDIMYPAWAFWEGGPAISLYPKGIGRWDQHRKLLGQVGNETKWNDKMSKAFFRGSRTSSERDALILLSRENPVLVDAQYTKNQAWKSDADTLHAPPAPEVSFEEHCKYKYLFNFRGVAASFRLKHILLCKSLVFHVGNDWIEFFYPFLRPWIHYIPVERDASKEKIKELLEFFENHQDLAQQIANNGYNFIWNNLQLKHVDCYWLNLIKRYTKLLKYKPTLGEGMKEIVGK